jgi:hypothetical protein
MAQVLLYGIPLSLGGAVGQAALNSGALNGGTIGYPIGSISSVSGTVSVVEGLSGAASTTASAFAELTTTYTLSGSSAATTSTSAWLNMFLAVAGSISEASSISGSASLSMILSGSGSVSVSVSAGVVDQYALAGQAGMTSSISGILGYVFGLNGGPIYSPSQKSLLGMMALNSASLNGPMAGSSNYCVTSASGTLGLTIPMNGFVLTFTNVGSAGTIQYDPLAAAISAASSVWGTASLSMAIGGVGISTTTTLFALLGLAENLGTAISGLSTSVAAATINLSSQLSATIVEITQAQGSMALAMRLAGAITEATITGQPTYLRVRPALDIVVTPSVDGIQISSVSVDSIQVTVEAA